MYFCYLCCFAEVADLPRNELYEGAYFLKSMVSELDMTIIGMNSIISVIIYRTKNFRYSRAVTEDVTVVNSVL